MEFSKFLKEKKIIIIAISTAIVAILIGIFLFFRMQSKKRIVFTEPEYLKEIILQKENFDGICDNFLDIADTFSNSQTDIKNLELRYNQAKKFVDLLETRLSPMVPEKSKNHFKNMMAVYRNYLEALEVYKNALPMELGEDRNTEIDRAANMFKECSDSFKNLKN